MLLKIDLFIRILLFVLHNHLKFQFFLDLGFIMSSLFESLVGWFVW